MNSGATRSTSTPATCRSRWHCSRPTGSWRSSTRRASLTGTFDLASFETLTQLATLTAGSIALMWIGELITERGIGNGISFIIFAGIVSRAPGALNGFIVNPNISAAVAFGIVAIAAVGVIIYIQEGPAPHPDPVRQPRSRPADVPGRADVPAPPREPGRRHPDHLRRQHPAVPAAAGVLLHDLGDPDRQADRGMGRDVLQPAIAPLHPHVLPADHGLHLLLHRVHVQTRRDRRAAPQERRLHPGHPARPARRRTTWRGS